MTSSHTHAPPAAAPAADVDVLLREARGAVDAAPALGDDAYHRYCRELGDELSAAWPELLAANATDVEAAQQRGFPATLVERLRLRVGHLEGLLELCRRVDAELDAVVRPERPLRSGDCLLHRVRRPLGVVLMVYEARPTVSVDGGLLPVVTGNAVLLRGGKEMTRTTAVVGDVVARALRRAGLPQRMVTFLDDQDRSVLRALLRRPDAIAVLIPRGSPSLVRACQASSIPLIASGGGVNHLYVHASADPLLAATITLDSKLPEPAGCTSVATVLVDHAIAEPYLRALHDAVAAQGACLTVHLDPALAGAGESLPSAGATNGSGWSVTELTPVDHGREYLEPEIGVVAVDGVEQASRYIRRHGSMHTEGVVAADVGVTAAFAAAVDAAAVVVNGSLRLHDGPRLGLGSELAIATGRLHVRGPVTLAALLTCNWVVEADGALRG